MKSNGQKTALQKSYLTINEKLHVQYQLLKKGVFYKALRNKSQVTFT